MKPTVIIAKIALFITLAVFGLISLNSGIFCLWAAGGPPNPTPGPWIVRGENNLALGFGCILLALAVPIGVLRLNGRSFRRVFIGRSLIICAIVIAVMPLFFHWKKINGCLDRGGKWDSDAYKCRMPGLKNEVQHA